MKRDHRRDLLWIAALVHRLSGLALAIFLPLHLFVLGLALNAPADLDRFLRWSDRPAVKLSEAVLVFLVCVHLLGGLRLLAIENLPWTGRQRTFAVSAAGAAALVMLLFLVRTL